VPTDPGGVDAWYVPAGGPALIERGRLRDQRKTPMTEVHVSGLVEAAPVPVWSSSGWSSVHGLEIGGMDTSLSLCGPDIYAASSSLRPLSAHDVEALRAGSRSGSPVVRLSDCFAMESVVLEDRHLLDEGSVQTTMWSDWTRCPGVIGVSVYSIEEGRPQWLLAQLLWPALWCDPWAEVLQQSPRRHAAQVVIFQPPAALLVYGWDGTEFTPVATTELSAEDAVTVLKHVAWSYRRWIVIATLLAAIRLGANYRRRKARQRRNIVASSAMAEADQEASRTRQEATR